MKLAKQNEFIREVAYFWSELRSGRFFASRKNLSLLRSNLSAIRANEIISVSPHPIEIYERLLAELRWGRIESIFEGRCSNHAILRHDLDTPECLARLSGLVAAEQQKELTSAIYVMADHQIYPLSSISETLRKLKEDGFHIGLHTRAHFHKKQESYLETELSNFVDALGSAPASISLHGEYPRPKNYSFMREKFLEQYSNFPAVKNVPLLNQFAYQKITDARFNLAGLQGRKSLLSIKFLTPLSFAYLGTVCVVINTHPIYWGGSG